MKFLAVAGAVAMLSTAGFTSCKQNNSPEGPGNYNGEVVKTQFTISIPDVKNDQTAEAPDVKRMPAANVQAQSTPVFTGMDNIRLLPFNVSTDKVASTAVRLGNIINLSDYKGASTGDIPADGLGSVDNYKVYSDVQIPLGTNHFLFYAHGKGPAGKAQSSYSVDESFEYGRLNVTGLTDATTQPSGITISPVAIYGGGNTEGDAIAAYLTGIANTYIGDGDPAVEVWATYSTVNGGNDGVKQLHDNLLDLEAGSALSVLKAVEDLYNSLELYQEAYKASHSDVPDQLVAKVMTNILGHADNDDPSRIIKVTGSTPGARTFAWKDAVAYKNYPRSINLPDGAAAIDWQTNKFVAVNTLNYGSFGVSDPTKYVYPACLYYFANSTLKTANYKASEDYDSKADWASILSDLYTANTFVESKTRSVAVVDRIRYGVGMLLTTVKIPSDAPESKIDDQKDNKVLASSLQMTGVLVGGQGNVDYAFTTTAQGNKVVYDPILTEGTYTLSTSATTANPTLLLETKENESIYMAVEFQNNGEDFYGYNGNIIPAGTKFYVVAQLNPASPSSGSRTRVFEQYYKTMVNLTLTNLDKAYNVIPDLRTESLEVGFSVDLTWETGNTYNIDIN